MPYDFQSDWLLLKARGSIPKEIVGFLEDVFQIMEIRERVGTIRGIKFEVRTREQNHNKPHVHVYYGEYEAAVAIDGELLAGSLPHKQLKIVTGWLAFYEEEAYKAWNLAVRGEHFDKIPPMK